LPIASGVVEAACKTLVTQRLKGSGMAWTPAGGQASLTLRSLIHSQRWQHAWALLHADFQHTVRELPAQTVMPDMHTELVPTAQRSIPSQHPGLYAALPLAV